MVYSASGASQKGWALRAALSACLVLYSSSLLLLSPDGAYESCADMVLPTEGIIGYSVAICISAQSQNSQIRDSDWCTLNWVLSSVQSCGLEGGTLAVEFPSSEAGNMGLDPE